jgi:hypothetical protein
VLAPAPSRECTGSPAKNVREAAGCCIPVRNTIACVPRGPRIGALALAALILAVGLLFAGCSRHTGVDRAPGACAGGIASERVAALRTALGKAPGPVVLADGTRISDCLARPIDSGDLETFGSTILTVTQRLADSAAGGDTRALTQLGYLIGAARRGAARAGGANDELVRRLDQELQDAEVASPAYGAGERAGRSTG